MLLVHTLQSQKHGWWQAPVDRSYTMFNIAKGDYLVTGSAFVECMKACSHIVAVALKNGKLPEYLAWHLRNNPIPNMTTLAESGLPKTSIGKKPAKRKGVSRNVSSLKRLSLKLMNQHGLSGSRCKVQVNHHNHPITIAGTRMYPYIIYKQPIHCHFYPDSF